MRAAGAKGLAVFARRSFREGEFIFRRRHGQVIANSAIGTLSLEDRRHLCELDFETSAVLLPPGCYLNHSCSPNAMRHGVTVFAWRPIAEREEITIDYRLNAFDVYSRWKCECGTDACSGEVVCSFFALPEETQRLYLPHAPAFIQRACGRRSRTGSFPRR